MFTHVSEECSASIFMVEDGCSALLWNVSNRLSNYTRHNPEDSLLHSYSLSPSNLTNKGFFVSFFRPHFSCLRLITNQLTDQSTNAVVQDLPGSVQSYLSWYLSWTGSHIHNYVYPFKFILVSAVFTLQDLNARLHLTAPYPLLGPGSQIPRGHKIW
jgi:hypothetical protein